MNQRDQNRLDNLTPKGQEKPKKKIKLHVREPLLIVACGKKGVGKTYTTLKVIDNAVKGNPEKGVKPQRVLIFDVNNEFEAKRLSLSSIKDWCKFGKPEARRITIYKVKEDSNLTVNGKKIYKTKGKKMTLREMADALFYILEHFNNGLLLIEDINRYVSDSLPNDLIGAICTQRHVGVDIYMHFQNIGRFGHPKILGNTNYLRLHKTTDFVERHKNKFEEYLEPLTIAETIVNTRYQNAKSRDDESFYVYFDVGKVKIRGDFDIQEYKKACELYLEKNYNSIVKPKMNEKDLRTGEQKYKDQSELVDYLIKDLIQNYYGND